MVDADEGAIVDGAHAASFAARNGLAGELKRLIGDANWRVFAVLDGAQFDDVSAELAAADIAHRSLYINVEDEELVDAGPWLVDFYHKPASQTATEEDLSSDEVDGPDTSDEALNAQADILADEMRAALEQGADPFESSPSDDHAPTADIALQVDALLAIVADRPAAVFWVGDASLSEERLWKHTRSINRVMIPRAFAGDDEDDSSIDDPAASAHVDVMFRHADGNVLAEVLPVLDAAQFARLYGPAKGLMFIAPDHPDRTGSTLRRAPLPNDAPSTTPGMLKLSKEQMLGIEASRLERSRRRVADYLRDVDPDTTEGLNNVELRSIILEYEQAGNDLGLQSERAHMKWAYLMSVSGGELGKRAETRKFFNESSKHPDDRIDDILDMFDEVWSEPKSIVQC
jgi:hypothetical protein